MVSRNREAQASNFNCKYDFNMILSVQPTNRIYLQENTSFFAPTRKARPHHWQHCKLGKLHLEDVEADPTTFIYVWMVHRGGEPDVGRL